MIAWRCPPDLLEALDAKAKRDGTARTDALAALVRLGLESRGSVEGELGEVKKELQRLRRAVEALGGARR